MRAIIWTVAVVLVAAWVLADPARAGDSVHGWVQGIFSFFAHLTRG
jgi:hypothetical protein